MADDVQIRIIGRDQASASLAKVRSEVRGLGSDAGSTHGLLAKLGGVVGTLGEVALGVAVGGLLALGGVIAGGIGDARAHAQVMAQTEQVIRSMGDAAGVSAQHVEDFAASLSAASGKSLFGDDEIQAATNMLLTFGNIKGEALDLATTLSVDMAQALKSTPEQMSMMIGKLLNSADAMSAAQRMGVSFTDAQIKLGKKLFETGRVAEYQALVMGELNKEFGGQAEAAAKADGGWAQLKDRLGETAETLGGLFLPLLNTAVAFLNDSVMPAVETAAAAFGPFIEYIRAVVEDGDYLNDFLTHLPASVQPFAQAIGELIAAIGPLVEYFRAVVQDGDYLNDFLTHLPPAIQPVVQFIGELIAAFQTAGPISLEFAQAVGQISPILGGLIAFASAVLPTLSALVQQVLGDVVAYFTENGAQMLAEAQTTWNSIQTTITSIAGPLADVVNAVLAQISAFWSAHGAEILATVGSVWSQVNQIIQVAMQLIQATIVPVLQFIAGFIRNHGAELQQIFSGAWQIISNVIQAALTLIKGILTAALQAIKGDWSGAWQTIQTMSAQFVTNILGAIQGGLTLIQGAFNSTIGAIRDIWNALVGDAAGIGNDIINGILNGLQASGGQIIGYLQGLAADALKAAKDALGISSPSKAFAEIGRDAILGLLGGLQAMLPDLLTTIQSITTDLLRQISDIDAQLKGKLSDSAKEALRKQRETLEKEVDSIAKAVEDLPDRIHTALADAFDASASIDRQAAKNIDAVSKLVGGLRAETQAALDEALAQAEQIQDPEKANQFFKERSAQILELARMQGELQEANAEGDSERAYALSRQIELIGEAQTKERAGQAERLQTDSNRSLGALLSPFQELFGPNGITIPGNMPPAIQQITDLIGRLSTSMSGGLTIAPGAITVNGAPGMSTQTLAEQVIAEIEKRFRSRGP